MYVTMPIWMALECLPDDELIPVLKYVRDENGDPVNLLQLRRYLREKRKEYEQSTILPGTH